MERFPVTELVQWLESEGGHCDQLRILQNRTVTAKQSISENTEIAFLPSHLVFSKPNLLGNNDFASKLWQTLSRSRDDFSLSDLNVTHLLLYCCLVYEKYVKGVESLWYPYLWSLPEVVNLPVIHPAKLIRDELAGSSAETYVMSKRAQLAREWKISQKLIADVDPDALQALTLSRYIWAHTIFSSRAFPLRASQTEEKQPVAIGDPSVEMCDVCLFPVLDMLNHRRAAKITWAQRSLPSSDGIAFIVGSNYDGGSQVFNNYGPKSNSEWLLGYGFVQADFRDDVLPFKINYKDDRLLIAKRAAIGLVTGVQNSDDTVESYFRYGDSYEDVVNAVNRSLFKILLSSSTEECSAAAGKGNTAGSKLLERECVELAISLATQRLSMLKLNGAPPSALEKSTKYTLEFKNNARTYMEGQLKIANLVIELGRKELCKMEKVETSICKTSPNKLAAER